MKLTEIEQLAVQQSHAISSLRKLQKEIKGMSVLNKNYRFTVIKIDQMNDLIDVCTDKILKLAFEPLKTKTENATV